MFLLGHSDKWELCRTISEYLALCKQYEEPETAKQFKAEAIQHQNRGGFDAATQKMRAALQEMK